MSVIGNPSKFAVEYELNAEHGDDWMYGKLCYWIGGERVGDYDTGTSLRDALFEIEQILKDSGSRNNHLLYKLTPDIAFYKIDACILGGSVPEDSIEEQWANHNITPALDIFNEWKCFIFSDEIQSKVLFSRSPFVEVKELQLDCNFVDYSLKMVANSLSLVYENAKKLRAS